MRMSSHLLALLLSVTSLVLLARGDEKRPTNRPATFPCKFGLEGKYEALQAKLPAAETIQALLQEDADGQSLVRWGEDRHISVWAGIDRRIAGEKGTVAVLAKLQDGEAKALLEAARRDGDFARILSVHRRHPWAGVTHEALAELGERELRRGNAGLALRCFHDALTRTTDPALRLRTQVGLWLALAQDDANTEILEAAFKDIKPDAAYPWMGGQLKAGAIRERLTAGKKSAPVVPALAHLERRVLPVPASPTWVHEQPGAHEEGVLVAGPNLLAWYPPGSDKPRWSHTVPTAPSTTLWAPVAPGPFVPLVARGRVYTRWSVEAVPEKPRDGGRRFQLTHVAAFDCKSGALLWSTARDPGWEGLVPVCDPTCADGRLYVLAVSAREEYSPILLVSLDADSGGVLWKRELVSASTTLAPPVERGRKPPAFREIDVTHFGNAVTVARGAVYCQTNMGVVARCDARDGLVEWVRSYPRDSGTAPFLTLARRQGAAPLVAGRRVLFLPRDALRVLALDGDTGEIAWEKTDDVSFHALGINGNQLLLADSRSITALDIGSGKVGWERRFDGSIEGKFSLADSTLYVGTSARLYRLSTVTGEAVEEQTWEAPPSMTGLAVRGKSLLVACRQEGGRE